MYSHIPSEYQGHIRLAYLCLLVDDQTWCAMIDFIAQLPQVSADS